MNATNFFTEETYNRIKADIEKEKIISFIDNPYAKEVKTNGNRYKLSIHTGRYTFEEKYGQYFYHLWVDYNFKGVHQSRDIGGYSITPSLDSYEDFKEDINNRLQNYPDYTEEETPLQFAIAF